MVNIKFNSWMDGGSTYLTLINPGDSDLESLKETDVGVQETIRWRGHMREVHVGGKYQVSCCDSIDSPHRMNETRHWNAVR